MKNTKSGIQIGLSEIKLLRFEIYDTPFLYDDSFDFSTIKNELSFNFEQVGDEKLKVLVHLSLRYDISEKEEIELLHVDSLFFFQINQLSEIIETKNDIISINAISVSYSTLRGIVYSKTLGFALNRMILPIINPVDFFENMKSKKGRKESSEADHQDKNQY